jgi:hypothetical protein
MPRRMTAVCSVGTPSLQAEFHKEQVLKLNLGYSQHNLTLWNTLDDVHDIKPFEVRN